MPISLYRLKDFLYCSTFPRRSQEESFGNREIYRSFIFIVRKPDRRPYGQKRADPETRGDRKRPERAGKRFPVPRLQKIQRIADGFFGKRGCGVRLLRRGEETTPEQERKRQRRKAAGVCESKVDRSVVCPKCGTAIRVGRDPDRNAHDD